MEVENFFDCLQENVDFAAPVSERMARNLRLPVGIVRIEVKDEMGEMFPGRVGLRHEIRIAQNVLQFYDKMVHSVRSDRDKWALLFVLHFGNVHAILSKNLIPLHPNGEKCVQEMVQAPGHDLGPPQWG